jgi:hypothetical protein
MALDPQSAGLEAVDRITVKIADLGNGERPFPLHVFFVFCFVLSVDVWRSRSSDLGRPPLYG